MKKNIISFAVFTLIVLAVVCAVQYSIYYFYQARVTQKFTKVYNHKVDEELMFFGSSVIFHDFDPRIIKKMTGLSEYNMGWDALFFVQYQSLLKEYITYEKKCKYLVLDCDFNNFYKNDLVTNPDLFLAYINNRYVYQSLAAVEPQKFFKARYLPGYALTLMGRSFFNNILNPGSEVDTFSGFIPYTWSWDGSDDTPPWYAMYDSTIFSQMRSCLDELTNKGIKVIMVETPVYREGYKKIVNADWIKEKYHTLAGKNVYFLDYTNDTMCNSKANFYNNTHLNYIGSAKFSYMFSNDLLKIMHENQ